MKIKERIIDAGFWAGWNVLWLLPEMLTRRAFSLVALMMWHRQSASVRQLEANLARLLGRDMSDPYIRQVSRIAIDSGMRYYAETFQIPRWSAQQINDKIILENQDAVLKAVHEGGVVLALPHSGNWDLAGAWGVKAFGSLCTVVERLRPEGVYRKFLAMREGMGLSLMPIRSEAGVYEFLRSNLRNGKVIALLGDRDVAKSGMSNMFCGHRGSFPIGPALLAIDTGAPLFACSTRYSGKHLVITFSDRIPVPGGESLGRERLRQAQAVTAAVLQQFEVMLAAHPESWHQLQPIWPDLNVRGAAAS